MNFGTFKSLQISEDFFMLLETNSEKNFLARFYSMGISFEDMSFGIYNTRNKEEFLKIAGSQANEWKELNFKEFINARKQIGIELQERMDDFFLMIKNEAFDCYEGIDYMIHVPRFKFRFTGPKTKYSFKKEVTEGYENYFLKVTNNDWQLEQTLNSGYKKIPKENINRIIEIWSPFLSLLMTESKYAYGIY